jgi:uncharacterized protein YjiK
MSSRRARAPVAAIPLVLLAAAASAAAAQTTDETWLPRYDLTAAAAHSVALERSLAEVSGLAFDGRGRLFAHDDDRARIQMLDPATGAILRTIWIGAPDFYGDFEGLAIAGRRFFLMTSDGTLLDFMEPAPGYAARYRRVNTQLGRRCELEGLAYDPATDALLAPCKVPTERGLQNRLTIFTIPLATLTPDPEPRVSVGFERLAAAGLEDGFHPSSIEVHPRSGSMVLVSAQEGAMLELSPSGEVLAVRVLSRGRHPQPEGLAFGPDLSLWIADEGGEGRGSLTRYPPPAGPTR